MKYDELSKLSFVEDNKGTIWARIWSDNKDTMLWQMKDKDQTWESAVDTYRRKRPEEWLVHPDSLCLDEMKAAELPPVEILEELDIIQSHKERDAGGFTWLPRQPCVFVQKMLNNQLDQVVLTMLDFGCPLSTIQERVIHASEKLKLVKKFMAVGQELKKVVREASCGLNRQQNPEEENDEPEPDPEQEWVDRQDGPPEENKPE